MLLKWEKEATTTTYYRRLIETLVKIFITYVQKLLPKQTLAFFSHVKCENLKLLQILFYLTWSAAKPVKDSKQSNPIDWFARTVTENFFFEIVHVKSCSSVECFLFTLFFRWNCPNSFDFKYLKCFTFGRPVMLSQYNLSMSVLFQKKSLKTLKRNLSLWNWERGVVVLKVYPEFTKNVLPT